MKAILTCTNHKLLSCVKHSRLDRCTVLLLQSHDNQVRHAHESYIPKGRGGRSSFSGVVATVFGSTGFLGHSVVNHLGANGASVMIPYRGTFERVQRMRVMGDLGQFHLREKFSIKQSDDDVMELIEHSNCVINLVKTRVPTNHYTMEEVNIEWPKRLANLVAEKNDGTRLLHVTHLNCHQPEGRAVSNMLQQDYVAEKAIREIYPDSIIVRSANLHGFMDKYTTILLDERFNRLWFTGAYPVLYDAGRSTVIQPVFSSDVAEGIARLLRHPTSPGHTFEFVGPHRFTLHDLVEYMYRYKNDQFYDYNTLGPMDRSKATFMQQVVHKMVEFYFWKRFKPRPYLPRVFDLITREGSSWSPWLTMDHFKQLHITDRTTGKLGLQDLGIEPCAFEEQFLQFGLHDYYTFENIRSSKDDIPKITPEEELAQTKQKTPLKAMKRILA